MTYTFMIFEDEVEELIPKVGDIFRVITVDPQVRDIPWGMGTFAGLVPEKAKEINCFNCDGGSVEWTISCHICRNKGILWAWEDDKYRYSTSGSGFIRKEEK